jgi:hypothetical protein
VNGFGLSEVSVTSGATVKSVVDITVPLDVVTATLPVVVPAATVAVKDVPEAETPVAATPFTVTLVTLHKFVPDTVMTVVALPAVGVKEVIVGAPTHVVVPKHESGTVNAVPVVELERDQAPLQVLPFIERLFCACPANDTDASAKSGNTNFDIRIQRFFM